MPTDTLPAAAPDKLQPHNVEAEEAVLGSLLIDPDAILRVAIFLQPSDFYVERHAWLFEAMRELHERREPSDLVTLGDELERRGRLGEMGGPAYLTSLMNATPTSIHVEFYARIVERTALLRRLIEAAGKIARLAYEDKTDVDEVVDRAEEIIFGISARRVERDLHPIGQIIDKYYDRIEYLHQHRGEIVGIPTGLADLDKMLGGMQRSDMLVLAGRPGMGKCVTADTQLIDPHTGDLVTIETLVQRRQANLLTLNDDYKLQSTTASDFIDDGLKPVYRVTTALGREIKVTLTHPFLTINGWRSLADLAIGDYVAVPRIILVFGNYDAPESEVKETAATKEIPACVYRYTRPKLALFLNRLFACDGSLYIQLGKQAAISYSTVSLKLGRSVQHLLLRFGIIAKLRHRQVKYEGCYRPAFELRITGTPNLRLFIENIGAFGKEEATAKIQAYIEQITANTNTDIIPLEIWEQIKQVKGQRTWRSLYDQMGLPHQANIHVGQRAPSRDRLQAIGQALESKQFINLAQSDVYWDKITDIEYLGEQQVYDLTVAGTHNFVADDMIVHNTSLALSIGLQAARRWQKRIAIFSLEMSDEQLVQRLISAETGIDSQRLRLGEIKDDEWPIFIQAANLLSNTAIFIDDTPAISAYELRTKARRLHAEHGLDLLIVDYLQLMSGEFNSENRQQEISFISRSIKSLARELNIPILALSQLSRQVESRSDKRPMLSDLRESGCLAGDTLIYLPDSGQYTPIRDLIGQTDFQVMSINPETWKLERSIVINTFSTGVKMLYCLTTQLGHAIHATANHKFLTIKGWKRLDELQQGECVALPRRLECSITETSSMNDAELALLGHLIGDGCTLPRRTIQYTTRELDLAEIVKNLAIEIFGDEVKPRIQQERSWYQVYIPSTRQLTHGVKSIVTEWLEDLGAFGLRSYEKRVPSKVFAQSSKKIATFLRHLWTTDGCINFSQNKKHYVTVYYASSSQGLAQDVQSLLLRVGINARLSRHPQNGKGRDQYHVVVSGKEELGQFVDIIGTLGCYKTKHLENIKQYLADRPANTNRDIIPHDIWRMYAVPAMQNCGLTTRQLHAKLGNVYCGTALYKQNISRERATRLAQAVQSREIAHLANSDVYWDKVVSVEADKEDEVYDLTVPQFHNFIANDVVVHNSIEQDADVVLFIYRDEVYNPESEFPNIAEIIVGKHRSGPTGKFQVFFKKQLAKFMDVEVKTQSLDY